MGGALENMRVYIRILAPISCLFALTACTSLNTSEGGRTVLFAGVTQIKVPSTIGQITSQSLRGFGLGWDRGPFFGWHESTWVIADPRNCQMIVIIRSNVEAEQATQVLERLKGENICAVDFSGTLYPDSH
jgi:hypothetical protein